MKKEKRERAKEQKNGRFGVGAGGSTRAPTMGGWLKFRYSFLWGKTKIRIGKRKVPPAGQRRKEEEKRKLECNARAEGLR